MKQLCADYKYSSGRLRMECSDADASRALEAFDAYGSGENYHDKSETLRIETTTGPAILQLSGLVSLWVNDMSSFVDQARRVIEISQEES